MSRTNTARQLRKCATAAERFLWNQLRANQLGGFHFRRQHPIGPHFVDFICRKRFLVVEVDGEYHEERLDADFERTRFLEARGYTVLRFSNGEVLDETRAVLDTILRHLPARPQPLP
jgi:very-short-patch-repair endonuclease